MLEIVKKQSSVLRQVDTQGGKRSPGLTAGLQETAAKTAASGDQSGDFDLAMVKQTTSIMS